MHEMESTTKEEETVDFYSLHTVIQRIKEKLLQDMQTEVVLLRGKKKQFAGGYYYNFVKICYQRRFRVHQQNVL